MDTQGNKRTYEADLSVAKAILKRDSQVTGEYMYKKCYPMFKSVYNSYFTDSENVHEFINEIYILVLTPSKETGRCPLENYRGESSLVTWLKTICLFYCYNRFKRKNRIPIVKIVSKEDDDDDSDDRFIDNSYTITMDQRSINRSDLEVLLGMMSNERYRAIIRLRYIEHKTNEETAAALEMSMANYYNKHKLAKEQFVSVLNKEDKK